MVQTADQLFQKEFRATLKSLSQPESIINMDDLWEPFVRPIGKPYTIQGIADDHPFSVLNGTVCRGLGGYKPESYVLGAGKVPKTDPAGNKLTQSTSAPKDSIFIRSEEKITIRTSFKRGKDGFDYANVWGTAPDGYRYLWAVPKKHLYEMSEVALTVSTRQMKAYKSYQFTTWAYGVVYVSIIPYNPNAKYEATRIIKVGTALELDDELASIVNNFIEMGIIPNVPDYDINNGEYNLVMKEITPAFVDFEPVSSTSLADTNEALSVSQEGEGQ